MEFNYDHMCFACGVQNQNGLQLKFNFHPGYTVSTEFIPREEHQGYPGLMHGGLISTVLDEIMARCVNSLGFQGVTARLEVRFKKGVPLHQRIKVDAWMVNHRKSIVDTEAKVSSEEGEILAEANARFMIMDWDIKGSVKNKEEQTNVDE